MKRFIGMAVLAAGAVFAEEKPAAPAGMPPMAKPGPEMKAEQWFVGTWSCAGQMHASPMGPEMKVASRIEFKMELGGFWMQVKGTATDGPAKGKELFEGFAGWDGTQYQRYDFQPGGMTHFTSKGWDGDKLVFDGEMMRQGQKMTLRHTINKKGENGYDGVLEMDGKPLREDTCTRSAAK